MDAKRTPRRVRRLPSWLLAMAAARASTLVADRARELGVSRAAFGVLSAIDENESTSQAELGRSLGLDRKTVSDEVALLERSGWVHREPDPADVRRNRLRLTRRGHDLLERLDESFQDLQSEIFDGVSPGDVRSIARILDRMLASVDSLPDK